MDGAALAAPHFLHIADKQGLTEELCVTNGYRGGDVVRFADLISVARAPFAVAHSPALSREPARGTACRCATDSRWKGPPFLGLSDFPALIAASRVSAYPPQVRTRPTSTCTKSEAG
jgi:hypothetical protein